MPQYLRLGAIPPKRHIAHPHIPGFKNEGIYYEEVVTTAGFSRAYSVVYHLRPPTRVTRLEPAGTIPSDFGEQPTLRHHHIKTAGLPRSGDPIGGRVLLFGNDDVTIARCRPDAPQEELFRNADADEVVFVHRGRGMLHTMFGPLAFREFDYVVIPRCTTYRFEFEAGCGPDLLVIESTGSLTIPARYVNADGQLKMGAPYSERDLHGPSEIGVVDRDQETSVLVKDGRRLTRYTLANHPFDVVGWDGFVYPYTFNADDFRAAHGQGAPCHRRCTRLSMRLALSYARLPPECSIPTHRQSRCRLLIRTYKPTRFCTTCAGISAAAGESRNRRSRCTRAAFRTARIPVPSWLAGMPARPMSWR